MAWREQPGPSPPYRPPCPACRGEGRRVCRVDVEPGRVTGVLRWADCPACRGTGREPPPVSGVVVTEDDGEPDP